MDSRDNATLARIEERLKSIEEGKLRAIELDIKEIKEDTKQNYASKSDLEVQALKNDSVDTRLKKVEDTIARIVWIIVTAILTAILYLVIKRPVL